MKWLGGAAALYGGYKLATQNSGDISRSFSGAMEGLEDDGDEFDAIYGFLDSTNEQMKSNPEYKSNLTSAGTALGVALAGAYLDGSFKGKDVMPERYLEDGPTELHTPEDQQNEEDESEAEPVPEQPQYEPLGISADGEGNEYMVLRGPSDEGENALYTMPMDDMGQYRINEEPSE